jgi:hypothetical protein
MFRNAQQKIRGVAQSIRHGLLVAYSPSRASHVIARSILEAPDDERTDILERFIKMKQRELATVLLSVCWAPAWLVD